MICPKCNGTGNCPADDCDCCFGSGEVEPCAVCERASTTDYLGVPSCGSPACELRLQRAQDYHDECGNR